MKTLITIIFSLMLVGCPTNEEEGFTSLTKGNLFGNGAEGFKKENIVISSKDLNECLEECCRTLIK